MGRGSTRERSPSAWPSDSVGRVRSGVELGRPTRFNPLLGGEEARIQIAHRHWVIPTQYHLNKSIILLIETIEDVRSELLRTKRLPDGGQDVREGPDLVEVGHRRRVQFLHCSQLRRICMAQTVDCEA